MNRKERRAQGKQGVDPRHIAMLLEQATALLRSGDGKAAERATRELLRLAPDHPFGHAHLAMIAYHAGDPAAAIRHAVRAVALDGTIADFHNIAALAHEAGGRLEEAIPFYRRAIDLAPDSAGLHSNLGTALMNLRRLEEAETACRRAVALQPQTAEYHNNLGLVLHEQGGLGAALACFEQAIGLKPSHAEAHNNKGNVYRDQGRLEEALACYERALGLKPDYAFADSNALLVLAYGALVPAAELVRRGQGWYERHRPAEAAAPRRKEERPDPARRLRIGLVSPDLHAHPVAQFIEPLLAAFSRAPLAQAVEITAYADLHHEDATSARLKTLVTRWRPIAGLADRAVQDLVARDRIDILLDLTGHNANNRLTLFAAKPTPIQASYLGYPATTGLPTIDYLIADAIAWLDGEPASESVWRLPRCHLAYAPPADAPPVAAAPQGPPTFGSFNQLSKLTPPTIRLWAATLRAIPQSRLLLKAAGFADNAEAARVTQLFAAEAVAADRLVLRGRTASFAEHLAGYGEIDIALDPIPYNGTTTSVEALWMGVPLLTLAGTSMVARMGATILTAAGMAAWIAESEEHFVAKAVAFAGDRARLAAMRAAQRERLQASELCNTQGLAEALAQAFRGMWQTHLARNSLSPPSGREGRGEGGHGA